MGFTFKIGKLTSYKEDGQKKYDAEDIELDDAPFYTSLTDYNTLDTTYSGWQVFTDTFDLGDLFDWGHAQQGEDHLIPEHPGYAYLTPKHKLLIDQAAAKEGPHADKFYGEYMKWLQFWVDYALKNIKKPVFVNR